MNMTYIWLIKVVIKGFSSLKCCHEIRWDWWIKLRDIPSSEMIGIWVISKNNTFMVSCHQKYCQTNVVHQIGTGNKFKIDSGVGHYYKHCKSSSKPSLCDIEKWAWSSECRNEQEFCGMGEWRKTSLGGILVMNLHFNMAKSSKKCISHDVDQYTEMYRWEDLVTFINWF